MNKAAAGFSVAVLLVCVTPALADVVAEEQASPAKGTKSCSIQQVHSEHLQAKFDADMKQYGYAAPVPDWNFVVDVARGGATSFVVLEDTFPGTRTFVLLDGHRYSGAGSVRIPSAPLLKEKLVQFTYTSWPENQDVNGEDVLDGFAAAYAECRKFMGS